MHLLTRFPLSAILLVFGLAQCTNYEDLSLEEALATAQEELSQGNYPTAHALASRALYLSDPALVDSAWRIVATSHGLLYTEDTPSPDTYWIEGPRINYQESRNNYGQLLGPTVTVSRSVVGVTPPVGHYWVLTQAASGAAADQYALLGPHGEQSTTLQVPGGFRHWKNVNRRAWRMFGMTTNDPGDLLLFAVPDSTVQWSLQYKDSTVFTLDWNHYAESICRADFWEAKWLLQAKTYLGTTTPLPIYAPIPQDSALQAWLAPQFNAYTAAYPAEPKVNRLQPQAVSDFLLTGLASSDPEVRLGALRKLTLSRDRLSEATQAAIIPHLLATADSTFWQVAVDWVGRAFSPEEAFTQSVLIPHLRTQLEQTEFHEYVFQALYQLQDHAYLKSQWARLYPALAMRVRQPLPGKLSHLHLTRRELSAYERSRQFLFNAFFDLATETELIKMFPQTRVVISNYTTAKKLVGRCEDVPFGAVFRLIPTENQRFLYLSEERVVFQGLSSELIDPDTVTRVGLLTQLHRQWEQAAYMDAFSTVHALQAVYGTPSADELPMSLPQYRLWAELDRSASTPNWCMEYGSESNVSEIQWIDVTGNGHEEVLIRRAEYSVESTFEPLTLYQYFPDSDQYRAINRIELLPQENLTGESAFWWYDDVDGDGRQEIMVVAVYDPAQDSWGGEYGTGTISEPVRLYRYDGTKYKSIPVDDMPGARAHITEHLKDYPYYQEHIDAW